MKLFIIGDLHLGVHALKLDRFLDITNNFFNEFFIPLLIKEYKPGDIIIQLGDVFDNRTSVNIKALDLGCRIFSRLEKIGIPIHIIVGNHDMWQEKSWDVTSLCVLKQFRNVTLHDRINRYNLNDLDCMFMPYYSDIKEQKNELEKAGHLDLLFCHSDLYGSKWDEYSKSTHGLSINDFVNIDKVYSGHIHIRQTINNFVYAGTPYQITRTDRGNNKGIYIFDTKTKKETFIENTISPKYQLIKVNDIKDIEQVELLLNQGNDFIDVEIGLTKLNESKSLRDSVKKLAETGRLQKINYKDDTITSDIDRDDSTIEILPNDWDIKKIAGAWLENKELDDKLKSKIEEITDQIFLLSEK